MALLVTVLFEEEALSEADCKELAAVVDHGIDRLEKYLAGLRDAPRNTCPMWREEGFASFVAAELARGPTTVGGSGT